MPDEANDCSYRAKAGACPRLLPVRIDLHDLRNAVLGIRGMRELLRANPEDSALDATFDEMIDHLATAVIALHSSVCGEVQATSLRWVDLGQAVAAAVLTSMPSQAQAYVDVQTRDGHGVITDPQLLHRVLDNLLRNAGEAISPPERISVRIAAGDGGSTITIRNRGSGVPDRTETVPSAKGLGHGLGLAAVRHLLAHHLGGRLALECLDGVVTATVELPAEPIADPIAVLSRQRRPVRTPRFEQAIGQG